MRKPLPNKELDAAGWPIPKPQRADVIAERAHAWHERKAALKRKTAEEMATKITKAAKVVSGHRENHLDDGA